MNDNFRNGQFVNTERSFLTDPSPASDTSSSFLLQTMRNRLGIRNSKHLDEKSMDQLVLDLTSKSWIVRVETVRALERFGEQSPPGALVATLSATLKDESQFVRAAAAQVLGTLREGSATDALLLALRDREWNVRASVIQALGNLGEQIPVEVVVTSLKDEDESVRAAAVWALGMLGDRAPLEPLFLATKDENEAVRAAAIGVLGTLEQSVPVAPIALALKDVDESVRAEAVCALEKRSEQAPVAFLIYALKDEEASVRATAAWALGERGEQAPIEPLMDALQDKDESVRAAAAWALRGRIPGEPSIDTIVKAEVSRYETPSWSLEKLDEPALLEIFFLNLSDFLRSNQGSVSSKVLGAAGNQTLVLTCRYEEGDTSVHDAVFSTLHPRCVVESLAAALTEKDELVRRVASEVIENVGASSWTECFIICFDRSNQVHELREPSSPARVILCGIGYEKAMSDVSRSEAARRTESAHSHSLLTQLLRVWTARSKQSIWEYPHRLVDLQVWCASSFSESLRPWWVNAEGNEVPYGYPKQREISSSHDGFC